MTEVQQNTGMTRVEFEEKLIIKAWQDEEFKKELLSNPKAVWEKELGKKAPEGVQITVVEETPNQFYMVLPVKPSEIEESSELSDEALEAVAGGGSFIIQTRNGSFILQW